MRDRAQQRIVWTLGVSALLHVWFMQTAAQPGTQRASAAVGGPITATLIQPNIDSDSARLAPQPAPNAVLNLQRPVAKNTEHAVVANSARSTAGQSVAVAVARTILPPAADATVAAAPTSQPNASSHDATYYTARDLDVFPKALTALDLGLRTGAAGKVRATVLIDEAGTVNDVRTLDSTGASVAAIESAARDLLLRARFTPASKDGRIVKAQLLVSLDYGSLAQ